MRQIYEKLPASDDNKLRASLAPDRRPGRQRRVRARRHAYALLPARKKQKVLMVTEDNLFLEGALLVYDNVDPLKVTPAEYDREAGDSPTAWTSSIFDDYTPEVVPPPPTSLLYFHPTGRAVAVHGRAASSATRASPRSTKTTRSCAG